VIDDFAHHPTAVRETLAAVRARYPESRLIAVFEPRSHTAQLKMFEDAFTTALSGAEVIVVAGLFRPERFDANSGLSPEAIARSLERLGRKASFIPNVDDIVLHLRGELRDGDVVVIMSNGSFGGIHQKMLDSLTQSSALSPQS
jgi:UDP-N-acetylmuramate: L-alanyl-gamma-D-glutamyl-meso-diaminopimelate ligase